MVHAAIGADCTDFGAAMKLSWKRVMFGFFVGLTAFVVGIALYLVQADRPPVPRIMVLDFRGLSLGAMAELYREAEFKALRRFIVRGLRVHLNLETADPTVLVREWAEHLPPDASTAFLFGPGYDGSGLEWATKRELFVQGTPTDAPLKDLLAVRTQPFVLEAGLQWPMDRQTAALEGLAREDVTLADAHLDDYVWYDRGFPLAEEIVRKYAPTMLWFSTSLVEKVGFAPGNAGSEADLEERYLPERQAWLLADLEQRLLPFLHRTQPETLIFIFSTPPYAGKRLVDIVFYGAHINASTSLEGDAIRDILPQTAFLALNPGEPVEVELPPDVTRLAQRLYVTPFLRERRVW